MISVIICTHNPRKEYLDQCIAALKAQTLDQSEWELVLIDNASSTDLSRTIDLSWHGKGRVVREEKLGLTPARLRGIREARGELVIFVDDDNLLDADFLATAKSVSLEKPFLGSWSGQSRPQFEETPEEWTRQYWEILAVREFEQDSWSNLPRLPATLPLGAGLCVRRAVAQEYLRLHDAGLREFQLDRKGASLISAGDHDLAACACDIGLGLGIMSSLKLRHLIPPQRLTLKYLAKLVEGVCISQVVLAHIRSSPDELQSYRVRWRDLVRIFLCVGPHRAIHLARLRGRRRGFELIKSIKVKSLA